MRQFSPPHMAALAVLVLLTAPWVWAARHRPGRWTVWGERLLASAIFAAWAGEYVADVILGVWSTTYTLPLQLTDVISLTAVAALLTHRRGLTELVYFWGLSASLQATITPDLGRAFPSVYYFTYFGYHIGAVTAGCVLVFGARAYPRRGAMSRAFGATLAWAAVAALADVITGGNYMYLAEKPAHGSLLSVLGPWPWYIAGAAVIALAMLAVLDVIARLAARRDGMMTIPTGADRESPAGSGPVGRPR